MYQHTKLRKFKARASRWLSLILTFALMMPILMIETPTVHADTNVGGPIISDTTWTLANSPYIVVENAQVMSGVTLTIQAGVVVKFNTGKLLQVDGTLVARGTAGNPITFTSNQASPAPGDWGYVYFTDGSVDATFDGAGNYVSGSILQYCVVEYGGGESAVHAPSAAPFIDHCTVRNNASRGICIAGSAGKLAVVSNNTVSGNSTSGRGGGIYATYSTVTGNNVSGNSITGGYGGGGIRASYSTVTGNTVAGNSSTSSYESYGGGIYAENYSTVTGNTVTGNFASSPSSREGFSYSYGGGIYARENSMVTGNTVTGNSSSSSGSGYYSHSHGGGIYAYQSTVTGNNVSGNSLSTTNCPYLFESCSSRGGGISAEGNSTVTGNNVSGNSASSSYDSRGGGIYASGGTVSGNTVSGNSATGTYGYGGGIYAYSAVMSNTVTANSVSATGQGAGVYFQSSNNLLYNTIVGNTTASPTAIIGGLAIEGTPQVHYNNLYGNSNYDVVVVSSSDISGTNNYWGTVATVDILAHVYDWYDDSARGRFLYIPYLQEPSPDAPFPPPTGLRANFQNGSAILSWDPHPSFTTGYGYKVYYDTDSSLPPYAGTGLNEGNSPIDVGNQTTYTLTGLDPSKDYYFTVTAYDNEGHESWYSNVEWKQGGYWVYLPVVLKNH